jgi:hypothetical protein
MRTMAPRKKIDKHGNKGNKHLGLSSSVATTAAMTTATKVAKKAAATAGTKAATKAAKKKKAATSDNVVPSLPVSARGFS